MASGAFSDMMDAAKLAMAIAIRSERTAGEVSGAETVWNIGTFDPDGEVRRLVTGLMPEVDAPYRAIEALIHVGLETLNREPRPWDIPGILSGQPASDGGPDLLG